jgi:hypothetical protein
VLVSVKPLRSYSAMNIVRIAGPAGAVLQVDEQPAPDAEARENVAELHVCRSSW